MNFAREGNGNDIEWKFDQAEQAINKALNQ